MNPTTRKWCGVLMIGLVLQAACSQHQRREAEEKLDRANREAREAGKKVKREADDLGRGIRRSAASDDVQLSTDDAGTKLRNGERDLAAATSSAARDLQRAKLIAAAKTTLISDLGLADATAIKVQSSGQTITLEGTVGSDGEKRRAGEAVARVDGVSKVVNNLKLR